MWIQIAFQDVLNSLTLRWNKTTTPQNNPHNQIRNHNKTQVKVEYDTPVEASGQLVCECIYVPLTDCPSRHATQQLSLHINCIYQLVGGGRPRYAALADSLVGTYISDARAPKRFLHTPWKRGVFPLEWWTPIPNTYRMFPQHTLPLLWQNTLNL